MKVIFIKEAQGVGHLGEVKEVNDGYARNYLIPKGLVIIATKHTLKMVDQHKTKIKKQEIKNKKNKSLLAKKINNKLFLIQANSDETGTLYAALDAKKISSELKNQGFNVEPDEIIMKENIKKTGAYKLSLNLDNETCKIKIDVK